MTSPAERYAASRSRSSRSKRFELGYSFALDEFQRDGCRAIDEGRGVLVAAPTGAGKTVVGEYAVHAALATGRKAFYTTPIKALSNQKFADLTAVHGAENVGLLTGDTSINGQAPVVVMTTEVLRNMLYAGSDALRGLGYVVMDEVHYLADRFRGPVWEEVILHLADDVQLVSLSATVSNAEEFGQWLTEVRGDTAVIVSEHRPVPLWQHVMVGSRLVDLYASEVDPTAPGVNPPISPDLVEAIRDAESSRPGSRGGGPGRRGSGGGHRRGQRGGHRPWQVRPAPRSIVVDRLDRAGLLPAIVFIFSRAGCDAAVLQLLTSGVRLTTPAEQDRIEEILAERTAALPREDLEVLGFWSWRQALLAGVASHHAGLLPVFKETVETLFTAGLIKVVFATETLALGINMPARSVVLEKLDKWDGQRHADVTAGEYTQLTGRAGRRGIDVEGHAVVLYSSGMDPVGIAGLASRRTYPLRSAFRPTYNMAVNLIDATGAARARETLETSFAQFQADRAVVGLARQARAHTEALEGYAEAMSCHLGDFGEYIELRDRISRREKELSRSRSREQREAVAEAVAGLRRGDVIQLPGGRRSGHAVVLERPDRADLDGPSVLVLTDESRVRRLGGAELPYGTRAIAQVRIPKQFNPRRPHDRKDLGASMRAALGALAHAAPGPERLPSRAGSDDDLARLRAALRAHPCHGCAEREDHARWAQRWHRLKVEHDKLMRRIEGRTSSIARDFDRVCEVLLALGYLDDSGAEEEPAGAGGLTVTEQGRRLRRIYSERDLIVAESLRGRFWQDLDAPELAAVVAGVLYEARGDEVSPFPPVPGGREGQLGRALLRTVAVSHDVAALERGTGLTAGDPLDLGLVLPMLRWASGGGLDSVLSGADLAAGDFVRWARQVLDLLDQLTLTAPTAAQRDRARAAIRLVRRGVVAQDVFG
ncbi:DEAD/DEAH box helicase [Pseudactinotalea sp. HY160]|uniref:DEAD/DEAH box helicase n=1 Tax=Pseudactinotalea sp. HY160 TaxID=2654490 RepID=UPI00128E49AE|nr:DEAD/DEAH box helicase [Pseudactinotalea sp. HY160]MPV49307.1 DEAD/DEAH box helicase [Pseudactinotalea sp. HY160]